MRKSDIIEREQVFSDRTEKKRAKTAGKSTFRVKISFVNRILLLLLVFLLLYSSFGLRTLYECENARYETLMELSEEVDK